MYYYIFDPPQGSKEYERVAQIKELIASLGIAGEIAQPHPGKSVEDLVEAALKKRYSTIIAVGGTQHVNRIAYALEGADVVYGIIPTIDHPDIFALLGVSSWKAAATILKRRRWLPTSVGIIGSNCFLTPATFTLPSTTSALVKTPTYGLESTGGTLKITTLPASEDGPAEVALTITHPTAPPSLLDRLRKRPQADTASIIHALFFDIQTSSEVTIDVAGEGIGTTPARFAPGHTLKLIRSTPTP